MPFDHRPRVLPPPSRIRDRLRDLPSAFRQIPSTFRLVREADAPGAVAVGALTLLQALLPAALAWVGKLVVDGVVTAARSGLEADRRRVVGLVVLELGLVAATTVTGLGYRFEAS